MTVPDDRLLSVPDPAAALKVRASEGLEAWVDWATPRCMALQRVYAERVDGCRRMLDLYTELDIRPDSRGALRDFVAAGRAVIADLDEDFRLLSSNSRSDHLHCWRHHRERRA